MQPPPNDMRLAIEAVGVTRAFGARRALDELDLQVRRGESLGLLGPNGAGKTTAIRVLSSQLHADARTLRVLGLDPRVDGAALRARIGVVPQELALYDDLSARENLVLFGRMHGLSNAVAHTRCDEALGRTGLADRAGDRVATFSGGMKRRLNLVASLLHEPEIVFLDEPTIGIDPQSRLRVFELIDALRARGATLVYTTHQLGEVERLCDRIVIMDRGRSIAQGTLAELRRHPSLGPASARRVIVEGRAEAALEVLRARGFDASLEEEALGLEEIYLSLTGRALRDEDV